MKLIYLMSWLAGGGLVVLATYFCVNLLKVCEERHEAESEAFWEILVPRDRT